MGTEWNHLDFSNCCKLLFEYIKEKDCQISIGIESEIVNSQKLNLLILQIPESVHFICQVSYDY